MAKIEKFLRSLFKKRFTCLHRSALIDTNEGYCPECGVYLKKYFYIIRCKCCDIKRDAKMHFDEITPGEKFCSNCGGQDFYIEKLEQINFTDVRFAIHKKEGHNGPKIRRATQVWVEEAASVHPHLKLIKRSEQSA